MSGTLQGTPDVEGLRRFAEALSNIGYRAKIENDVIVTSAAGVRISLQLYDNTSIQLATGVRGVPEAFGLEQINEFNRKYRFGSTYQEGPGTIVLQANFLADSSEEVSTEFVERIVNLFEGLVGELRDAIAEITEADDDSAS